MDLGFSPFDRDQELSAWPGDLAVLMIGVAARQGASPTAVAQALLTVAPAIVAASLREGPLAPADGAFNGAVALVLMQWTDP